MAPTLTSVSLSGGVAGSGAGGSGGPGGPAVSTAVCGKPLASLTASQLAFCLRSFADELAGRAGQPSASPAATGG